MTNREKYAKEIIDIAIKGKIFAVVNGKPTIENTTSCQQCDFKNIYGCTEVRERWANSEYVEPPVDWSKVAVDTPILVRASGEENWRKRYFAKYENGIVYAWGDGTTSWSAYRSDDITGWDMAKLVENDDVEVEKPQTNADRIRSMTDDGLAKWFDTVTKDVLGGSAWDKDGWLKWLQTEN